MRANAVCCCIAVLHRVWAGKGEGGIRSLAGLQAIPDLRQFVRQIVPISAMAENFDLAFRGRRNSLPRRFPTRYLELEAERLTGLVTEWLEFERQRRPFTVSETEVKREVTIAGLTLRLRLDRIDELPDGGQLVIDLQDRRRRSSARLGWRSPGRCADCLSMPPLPSRKSWKDWSSPKSGQAKPISPGASGTPTKPCSKSWARERQWCRIR